MNKYFKFIEIISSLIITSFIKLFGGLDYIFIALLFFISTDFITGIIKAIINKELNSIKCFNGLLHKILILIMIAFANIVENLLNASGLNTGDALRDIVIIYYCINESISILENVSPFLPIPEKLKKVLEQLKNYNDSASE